MYRGYTASVVVPAYNEAPFVGAVIESVPSFVDRVYVVEDGSTDDTWNEITAAAERVNARVSVPPALADEFEKRVVPIQHDANRGVGGAIKTGYLRARDDEIDLTAVMGGDGQMEVEMLGELFDPIVDGQADYTKGNRFLNRTDRGDMPAFRFIGNATLTVLTKLASGYWGCGDPQSGYTAISLHALETADIESMYEFYGYCNDLLVKLNVADLRVVDVPRPITYGDEESHIQYHTYIPRVSGMLLRNFFWRLRINYLTFDFHPLVGAYLGSFIAGVATLVAGVWALPGIGSVGSPVARGGVALSFGLVTLFAFTWAMAMDKEANDHLNDAVRPRGSDRDGPNGQERQPQNGELPDSSIISPPSGTEQEEGSYGSNSASD